MRHVVFYSGGIGSYVTAKRVLDGADPKDVVLLFTDTKSEDPDLYRFLNDTSKFLGVELLTLCDGRDVWQTFDDEGMIGNTMADVCSRVLKRDVARKWIEENCEPNDTRLYFGIDHSEKKRFYGSEEYTAEKSEVVVQFHPTTRRPYLVKVVTPAHGKPGIRRNWLPYVAVAPLCDLPPMTKCEMLKECERDGIDPPRIYDEGFPHNNCNGFCVKAGHAQFLHLLKTRPAVFEENAQKEREFRERTGKDVAVMKDRRGGTTTPLPMFEFKRQVEAGERGVDPRDWGKGCQCFTPEENDGDSKE